MSILALLILAVSGGIIFFAIHPEVLHSSNWPDAVFLKEIMPIQELWSDMQKYADSHPGQFPQSIEQFTSAYNAEKILDDSRRNRVYSRTAMLQNVRTLSGKHFNWVLVLRVPESGMFGPFKEDLIYAIGDGNLGEVYPVSTAEKYLGKEMIEAAYRKDREGSARPE